MIGGSDPVAGDGPKTLLANADLSQRAVRLEHLKDLNRGKRKQAVGRLSDWVSPSVVGRAVVQRHRQFDLGYGLRLEAGMNSLETFGL